MNNPIMSSPLSISTSEGFLSKLNPGLIIVTFLLFAVGFAMLYSAASGNLHPWAIRQAIHFLIGCFAIIVIALIPLKLWYILSYPIYLGGLGLLVLVELAGVEGGLGAQRWLNIAGFSFQPSELFKITLIIALAGYFNGVHRNNMTKLWVLIIPILLTALPVLLILKQPNLGTATIVAMIATIIAFMAGVGWKKFVVVGIVALLALPVAWQQLHSYQKERIYTFLDPQRDPLGAGYNIIQSKIAIGSGGFYGKGLLQGTQSQLEFVPEKQTDFIFSILAEELGFIGGCAVIFLYALLIIILWKISLNSQSMFGRLIAGGVAIMIFLHAFINMGMVMGILPVVGVPLPLLSYGGSSVLSSMIGLGFALNVHINRNRPISISL